MSLSTALARLLGRGQNPLSSRLSAHLVGRPLLVHPHIAEQLLAGVYRGAGLGGGDAYDDDENDGTGQSASVQGAKGVIAILNVSGPMTSRPEPGMSGTPCSYEAVCNAFDAALADGNVSHIVFRLNTCGGEAAQCFDLTDHIFASRGKKPIIAQVDDIAYSGGYAIAAACDRIQLSRTGGVGSVGVVRCHMDQSGADAQAGLKFTYIFSGDHKVDGNPHEALPASVKNAWKAQGDTLRDLFVASVAKYRGMSIDAVMATEAEDYMGEAAITVGFADTQGTLRELLAELAAPAEPAAPETQTTEEEAPMEVQTPAAGAVTETPEQIAARVTQAAKDTKLATDNQRKAALLDAVNAASLSIEVRSAVLAKGPAENMEAAAQVAEASHIADLCAAAKLPDYAADYVKAGKSVETVRKELTDPPKGADGKVIRQREIATQLPARAGTSSNNVDTAAVFGPAVKQMQAERSGPGFKSGKPNY